MQAEFKAEYSYGGDRFEAVAKRRDFSWGKGLIVAVLAASGEVWCEAVYCNHPEFDDYEACQSLETPELLAIAVQRLGNGEHRQLEEARQSGFPQVLLHLNGDKWRGLFWK